MFCFRIKHLDLWDLGNGPYVLLSFKRHMAEIKTLNMTLAELLRNPNKYKICKIIEEKFYMLTKMFLQRKPRGFLRILRDDHDKSFNEHRKLVVMKKISLKLFKSHNNFFLITAHESR